MSFLWLLLAVLAEVIGTTSLKLSSGLTKPLPSFNMLLFYGLSFISLAWALKRLDVGLAFAIWAGSSTALIAVVGVLWFHEPMTALKGGCFLLILGGVIGLYLSHIK